MRTLLVLVTMLVVTPPWATACIVAAVFGVRDREGSVYRRALRVWGRSLCWAAGARVVPHGLERLRGGRSQVIVANHVSWFDVFALASALPDFVFVAKSELQGIPLLGRAAVAAGHVFIERDNRKAAFAAYESAAARIRKGARVLVFPEGTRGRSYPLRPFKKGPFVLAIAAGAPIVPILIHGSLEVQRKGSPVVRANDIHIHVLDDMPTEGLTYEDRDVLARRAYDAMRVAQQQAYGVESPPWRSRGEPRSAAEATAAGGT
jgi:1-acyl-sn-glycerol-3-phosphate acyltransferase